MPFGRFRYCNLGGDRLIPCRHVLWDAIVEVKKLHEGGRFLVSSCLRIWVPFEVHILGLWRALQQETQVLPLCIELSSLSTPSPKEQQPMHPKVHNLQ